MLWPLLGQGVANRQPCSPYSINAPPSSPYIALSSGSANLVYSHLIANIKGHVQVQYQAQKKQDMLMLLREPLSPESIATIVSGSASQLDEGAEDLSGVGGEHEVDLDLALDRLKLPSKLKKAMRSNSDIHLMEMPSEINGINQDPEAPSEYCKGDSAKATIRVLQLQCEQAQRSKEHQAETDAAERREVVMESEDPEGVQLFRQSYKFWRTLKKKFVSPFK